MRPESSEALTLFNNAQAMLEHAAEVQQEELQAGQAVFEAIISAIVT